MKLGAVPVVVYDAIEVKNLYTTVVEAYSNVLYVIIYVISMIVIGFHLYHGFQSSFQTLGLNHKKYTPLIQGLGKVYAILVPLGFALIPLIMFGKISGLI
jgi:succinate dehydrogenase / fumarate reductase cytochrome b subunit